MSKWVIDTNHSEIIFKVKHLVISTVTGKFTSFDASAESSNDDFSDLKISFSADINSISTGNEQRDTHLKSADFFDAAKYPKLNFVSTSFTHKADSHYTLKGNFTLKEITKPVELAVEFGGLQKDFYGNMVAGFEMTGKINRQDFGLTWSAVTEAGGIVVSDEVKLSANIELHKKD